MLRIDQLATLRCGNQLVELKNPVVMGILNASPDSFYAPSRVNFSDGFFLQQAKKMVEEGATILDVGGISTRPGSTEIPLEEELLRVVPMVKVLHSNLPDIVISVDTYRSEVAEHCIQAGAYMINDISGGLRDERILDVVAQSHAAYVLMHMRGTPADMQEHTHYDNLMSDLVKYFVERLRLLHHKGIRDIVIDPGFGFAKTMEQNYQIINGLEMFSFLGCPVMVGISRKSSLSKTINKPVEETLEATTALHMVALQHGASILRAHDVRAAMDTIAIFHQTEWVNTLNNKSLSKA